MKNSNILFTTIRIFSAILLFIAIADLPYGYYRFVRLFTFIVSGYGFYKSYKIENEILMIPYGIISLIFNPIYPIYMSKEIWQVIDFISGTFLIVSIFIFKSSYCKNTKKDYVIDSNSDESDSFDFIERISKGLEKKGIKDSLAEFREIEKEVRKTRGSRTQDENDNIDEFMEMMKEKMKNN